MFQKKFKQLHRVPQKDYPQVMAVISSSVKLIFTGNNNRSCKDCLYHIIMHQIHNFQQINQIGNIVKTCPVKGVIYNFIHHRTMIANNESKQMKIINKATLTTNVLQKKRHRTIYIF